MKFLILTVLCFSPALSLIAEQALDKLREQQDCCAELSGLCKEDLELIRLDRQICEDEDQEDFAACMLQKFNIMNVDGSINPDSLSYELVTDNPESFETARICATNVCATVRETARNIMNCLLQTDIIVIDPRP